MYPNVYLHNTTRGIEKIFSALIVRIHTLIEEGSVDATGLNRSHPIVLFLKDPGNLDLALKLDDTLLWGSLHFTCEAEDALVREYSLRLQERRPLKCIDVRKQIESRTPVRRGMNRDDIQERDANVTLRIKSALKDAAEISSARQRKGLPEFHLDEYRRSPYKKFQDSQTPLNQILIRQSETIEDMAHLSSVVSSAESFEINRIYLSEDDKDGHAAISKILSE